MKYYYCKYYRYGFEFQDNFSTKDLESLVGVIREMVDGDQLYPTGIYDSDGNIVLTQDELFDKLYESEGE